MKLYTKIITFCVLTVIVALSAMAGKKARKLPVGAYIKSAKIAIISGDIERYPEAIAMLDSLFMYYGPDAEALNWMAQINVDYIEKTADPRKKKPYVEKMVAYFDSLSLCCNNKEIKKKYRKNCKKYIEQADATRDNYWRIFYNQGVEQLTAMGELQAEIAKADDSATRAIFEKNLQANGDSCIANMELAIIVDPQNHQTYIGIGSAYDKLNNPEKALEWQIIGLEKAPDENKPDMALSIGYTYINMNKYCDAIPYLKTYLEANPQDTTWLYNLSICYNNCGQYDEAMKVYQQILTLNPGHMKVLTGIGRYFNDQARKAADSSRVYQNAGDTDKVKHWRAESDRFFDSSHVYFKRAFQSDPNDEFVADMYGLVSSLRQKYEDAAEGYAQLCAIRPDNAEYWTYLGDTQIRLSRFDEAIKSYEKSVELDPNKVGVWEKLAELYQNQKMKQKEAAARKKIAEMKP